MIDNIEKSLDEIDGIVRDLGSYIYAEDVRADIRAVLLRLMATAEPQGKTLAQARIKVAAGIKTKPGIICPCCDKLAKIYRRGICGSVANYLHAMIMAHESGLGTEGWLYITGKKSGGKCVGDLLAPAGGDYAKLRWWGLVDNKPLIRKDGSKRSGYWRVTELGYKFARGEAKVRKYFYEYNNEPIAIQPECKLVSIHEIRGVEFDFRSIKEPPPRG